MIVHIKRFCKRNIFPKNCRILETKIGGAKIRTRLSFSQIFNNLFLAQLKKNLLSLSVRSFHLDAPLKVYYKHSKCLLTSEMTPASLREKIKRQYYPKQYYCMRLLITVSI